MPEALSILRDSPLASMLVSDAYKKIEAHGQIRHRPGEVIGDYIVREQRAFREMTETPETRKLEDEVAVI